MRLRSGRPYVRQQLGVGFVEWVGKSSTNPSCRPILLMPIQLHLRPSVLTVGQ
jgi:hypothetical protein